MADKRRTRFLPIHRIETSLQDATYVQSGTKIERIARLLGINSRGRLAKTKEGGYGVETVSGRRIESWHVSRYLREDPQWFFSNLSSIVEASNSWSPQVLAVAMLLMEDVCTTLIEAGVSAPVPFILRPQTQTALQQLIADACAGDQSVLGSIKTAGFEVRDDRTNRPLSDRHLG